MQRAWRGGVAEDALHTAAFALRVENAPRFLENQARFVSNAEIFARRLAANPDDGEALYFLAHSLKDAGSFSRALPVFERRVAMGTRDNATQEERDHVFLSHMLSGRIYAVHGKVEQAQTSYLRAMEALPPRRTEALAELATTLRLVGRLPQALPFAKAASQAALADAAPAESALYVNEASYDFFADLELSLAAYSAASTEDLVAGAQALARLLSKPHILRRYWLASYDNAAAFIAKLEARKPEVNTAAGQAVTALRAAMTPTPHVCRHERVWLHGAVADAADDTSCGPDSVLGRLFSGVAVIELPSRERHVARFLASMGCSHYLRFPAVAQLTPAELSREHNPRLRNGEMRLVQAHACVLQHAASLPAGARPLAIFEDDVALLPPATLPAVQLVTARLASAFDGDGADMVLLGRCPCTPVNASLPADALVQPVEHGFAAVCAHAYAVVPAAAARVHAMLSAAASSLPAELDIMYMRMQERGELRVFTNAGASVFSQKQLPVALGAAQLKGPSCAAVKLLPAADKPPLKLTSFGFWISNAVTLDEMWLLSFVLQNVTGRAVEQIDPARIAEADVIFVGVFAASRSLVEAMIAERSAEAVIIFAVGENTHDNTHKHSAAYLDQLVPLADVSLGHRRDVDAPSYLRMPWWVPTALVRRSAATSLDAVGFHPALLHRANASAWASRPGFALFVNGHEAHPRREMLALASTLGHVDAPGHALNNMPWPRELSNDIAGKRELLTRYRFTLCPENSVSRDRGYVTEKLPQAHLEGAVPLYWGDAAADGDVWNMRRVLSYDNRSSNAELLGTMLRLEHDPAFREAWFAEPVLAPGANAWLSAFMAGLAGHFSHALAAKGHAVVASQPVAAPPSAPPSPSPLPPRVHLVSLCGCAFEARRAAFAAEARASGFFDSVSVAALEDLDAAFRQQHAAILSRERGCGFYIWKAKAALTALLFPHVRQGDVLVYIDCGCTFNASARSVFEAWVAATAAAPSGLLAVQMPHLLERDWTKADVLHHLGVDNDPAVTHTGQLLGGIWLMRVQPSTVALLQRWLEVKTAEAYRFVDDSPSRLPNAPSFEEHRHDQSIWSVLRKQAGAALVPDTTYRNASSPIRAARCMSALGCDPPSHPLPFVYPYADEEGLLGRHFFDNGVERQIQELVRLSVSGSALFVDVGANTGFFSLLAASYGSSVLAFEPQPHCAELMRATLRSANAQHARLIDFRTAAVGDAAAGSIRVPSTTCWGGFNAGATEHSAPQDAEVPLVSLAAAVSPTQAQRSVVIKIDTEGAEVSVLKGVLELRQRHPERAMRVIVELIPRLWVARGSSTEEGVEVLRQLQRWFTVTLLHDETGFGFPRRSAQLPGGVGGAAFDGFDLEALVRDRMHANAGCNLLLDSASSAGLLSGKLVGGLGNQLFIAARVHSLAAETGRRAVLYAADATSCVHTPAGAYVDTVFARYARTDAAPDALIPEAAEFVAAPPPAVPASARHAHLDGYWQHESNVRPDFASTLALPAVAPRPHTAFVHMRRGDYVGHRVHDVGLVDGGYYSKAMALLREKAGDPLLRFLVFSDDLEWCRRSELFGSLAGAEVDFFDDGGDAALSLMTMAACALGGVAANSSFSWWAAFLNSSPLKVIVFPLRWLNGFHGPIDVWLNNSYVVHPDGHAQFVQRPPAVSPAPPLAPPPPAASSFDLVVFINLDNRDDKRAAIEAELARVDWSGRRLAADRRVPGELGCALSHVAALQLLLEHPSARHALILEDDFQFVRDPRADVARFLDRFGHDGWDVLMLSSNTVAEQLVDDVAYVTRILEAQTTSGYAVTRAFAPALLRSFSESAQLLANASLRHADGAVQTEHCIDQRWKRLQPLARWFCLAPRAGAQRPGLSDISGLVVDHGGV